MITERDLAILRALARYFVLNRVQIQRLCFPTDGDGRVTRRRLNTLTAQRWINRTQMQIVDLAGSAAPAYYPSRKGCELLAEQAGDDRFLATPTQTPQPHHLPHWIAVSETHLALDAALALPNSSHVACLDWLNEWDVANKDESDAAGRYRLYTLIHESPRLVCAPDAAFLLSAAGHAMTFYLEQDRGTSGVRQVAFSKTPGYSAMLDRTLHRRHFPRTTLDRFVVLMVTTTDRRREALRKAIADRPGAPLWRFACGSDLRPERVLFDPIWHRCDGEIVPLIKPLATSGGES